VPAGRTPRPRLGPLLRSRLDLVALVAVGGAAGALARWSVDHALPHTAGTPSWSTLLLNTSGSLLLGALVVALARRRPGSRRLRPLLGTGVLGGYTTFSAAALDVQQLLALGRPAAAGLAAGLGLVLPVLAAWAGAVLTAALLAARRPHDGVRA
jgi:CrcB protein